MITEDELVRRLHSARDAAVRAVPASASEPVDLVVAPAVDTRRGRRDRRPRRVAVGAVGGGLLAAAVVVAVAVPVAAGPGATTTSTSAPPAAATAHPPALAFTYVAESDSTGVTRELWIPADTVHGTWMLHVPATTTSPDIRQTAVCAAFPLYRLTSFGGTAPLPGCDLSGGWDLYRPPFAAAIPDDPALVISSIRGDHRGDAAVFAIGASFAGSGMVPAPAVTRIVRALETLPGATVTHGVANAAGVEGDAVSYTGQVQPGVTQTFTLLVDPVSGDAIGSADSTTGQAPHLTAVTRTAVRSLGATS